MFPTFCLLHPVNEDYATGKRGKGLCITWRCSRKRSKESLRCNTCHCRLHRLRHPDNYAFQALKASARKRRIPFNLSLIEFRTFISGSEYLQKKGRDPNSLTIDRIFTDQPYHFSNLRFLTHADNSSHKYEQNSNPSGEADY